MLFRYYHRLRTGWSVKTGSLGYQSSSLPSTSTNNALDPDEQAAILEVIHRAEQLELREQERVTHCYQKHGLTVLILTSGKYFLQVGRLVDRLENMRRNALGRTPSQCLLCGDHFGLLGAQSAQCIACRKLVCQKCAIEACTKKNSHHHHG